MQIYLVGGAVRDQLLGYPVYDRDWVVVGATPDMMRKQGFLPVGSDFPVFIHPQTSEEYALARTERKSGIGYGGFQFHTSPEVTLEQDLLRRDLTINAIAQSDSGELIDPYGGQQDLADRKLRHVSPAFSEDPLRVLRVARFAARYAHLGFAVAKPTIELMAEISDSGELEALTQERVWKELSRALQEPSPMVFFQVLNQAHGLERLLPELANLEFSAADTIDTALAPLELAEQRLAVLFSLCQSKASDEQTKLFAEKLRCPNSTRELLVNTQRWQQQLLNWPTLTGEQRLEVIRGVDLLRRPERLMPLIEVIQVLAKLTGSDLPIEALNRLPALLEQLKASTPKELMAEGFKGAALGEAIRQRQQQLCQ